MGDPQTGRNTVLDKLAIVAVAFVAGMFAWAWFASWALIGVLA